MDETKEQELQKILRRMHMILFPGEYGLGTEPESHWEDTPKESLERLGRLLDEAYEVMYPPEEIEAGIDEGYRVVIARIEAERAGPPGVDGDDELTQEDHRAQLPL
jgi:hypothetical protein